MNEKASKYRILLVIRHPVGGIRTFIRYVYNKIDYARFRITIIGPDIPEFRILLEDLKKYDPSAIFFEKNSSSLNDLLSVFKTIVKGKFDLIHSHGFIAGMLCSLPARLTRTPHIVTPQDILSSKIFKGFGGFFKRKALSILFPRIDVIHCVSKAVQDNLLEHIPKLRKSKTRQIIIPNGVEIERFLHSPVRNLRKELNLSDDMFLIGFLGRFMAPKGFRILIDGMAIIVGDHDLPKRPLVLAFGDGGFIREDRADLQQKGIGAYFKFLQFTPNVAPTLKGLDVVVMPSLWEACPLLPMEAMVAGVPVIGTDCPGMMEVLNRTPSAVCQAGNSVALAEALKSEIRSPSRWKAEAFQKEAAARFTVERQAIRIEQLMIELLKKSDAI